jgi:hypothetical protein
MREFHKEDYLFAQGQLSDVFRNAGAALRKEVGEFDQDYILNTNESELVAYLVDRFTWHPPEVAGDPEIVSNDEVNVDVSRRPDRVHFDYDDGPRHVRGRRVVLALPMKGQVELCRFRPSTSSSMIPLGKVHNGEIRLTYDTTRQDPAELRAQVDQDVSTIKQYCGWIAEDLRPYNAGIEASVREVVAARKKKLLGDAGLVTGLGFKMRNVAAQPATYAAPVRRVIRPSRQPAPSGVATAPEPTLSMEDYEHILGVMHNMSVVMERSPSTFAGLGEEALRDHFLVQLNGHYEGEATGETFNHQGKTDILIRHEGGNVFVAECKFWDGEKALLATIDQLLGYITWRDTKTAIVLLNRDRNMTTVLGKVDGVVKQHPSFKSAADHPRQAEFRYVLRHPGDSEREIRMALLCFDVPRP